MKQKLRFAAAALAFVLLLCLLLSALNRIFIRKTTEGAWNYTTKIEGFYNENKNEFDVMYFGSSNTYCSFNPLIVYENTGVKSYVLATQQQPMWATYTYIKEALKTQNPKLVVLDVLMLSKDEDYYDDGVNFSFMDNLPLSKNKVELAFASAPKGERAALIFPFIKYHTRYNELTKEDFTHKKSRQSDYLKGYVLLEDTFADAVYNDVSHAGSAAALNEKELMYFEKIRLLLEDKNIPLLLVKAPSNPTVDEQERFNAVKEIADSYGIDFIDYNKRYNEIGLDLKSDFYDKSHLNYKGAEKFSAYFAKTVLSGFSPQKSADWDEDLKKYYEYTESL